MSIKKTVRFDNNEEMEFLKNGTSEKSFIGWKSVWYIKKEAFFIKKSETMSTNVCIAYCNLYLSNYIKLLWTAAFEFINYQLPILSIVNYWF